MGVSAEAAEFIFGSWSLGTRMVYRPYILRWGEFSFRRENVPVRPSVGVLLEFENGYTNGLCFWTLGVVREAVSSGAVIDGLPAGQHRFVCRLM